MKQLHASLQHAAFVIQHASNEIDTGRHTGNGDLSVARLAFIDADSQVHHTVPTCDDQNKTCP